MIYVSVTMATATEKRGAGTKPLSIFYEFWISETIDNSPSLPPSLSLSLPSLLLKKNITAF